MTNESNPHRQPEPERHAVPPSRDVHDHEQRARRIRPIGRGHWCGMVIVLLAFVALAMLRHSEARIHNDEVLAETTQAAAAPTVIATSAAAGRPGRHVYRCPAM